MVGQRSRVGGISGVRSDRLSIKRVQVCKARVFPRRVRSGGKEVRRTDDIVQLRERIKPFGTLFVVRKGQGDNFRGLHLILN